MNVTPALTVASIKQAFGSGLRYQFLDTKLNGVHPPVFCRDCLQMVVWSEITYKSAGYSGFYYVGGKLDLPKKRFKIALDYISAQKQVQLSEEQKNKMKLLLHYFEDCMKIERSSFSMKNNDYYIVVESSSKWLQRPYLTSLYTLILRYALKFNREPIEQFIYYPSGLGSDEHYMRWSSDVIKLTLAGEDLNQTYDDYLSDEDVYRNSGLMETSKKLKKNVESISA